MTEQIGLHKFILAQKRFSNGAFYLAVVLYDEKLKALDARFYLEDGFDLVPTKNGFRIPIEKLEEFKKLLKQDLRNFEDIELFKNNSFSFHVRYLNDKYGEGIDFRKYKTVKKYTGWDRSGIRMKLEDVSSMRSWLESFDQKNAKDSKDLFEGKGIGHASEEKQRNIGTANADVNPAIKKILEY